MTKVILGAGVGGFSLNRGIVEGLFQRKPELFDGPLPLRGFLLWDTDPAERVLRQYWNAVLQDGGLYFLQESMPALRTDQELIRILESQGEAALRGDYGQRLAVVEVPDNVEWCVFVDDDGSEAVCETRRMWRAPGQLGQAAG